MLSFVAIGLDHTTAGIELREWLAFADGEIPAVLQRLTDPAGSPRSSRNTRASRRRKLRGR
jgi:hypothetical protein